MKRWVLDLYLFSIRLHHWMSSDDQRHYHDHPWNFITIVLAGGYTDIAPSNQEDPDSRPIHERMTPGTICHRASFHKHTVKVDDGGCWTLLLTGRPIRTWGFWVKRKDGSGIWRMRKRNKYFREMGHHPCEGRNNNE